MILFLQIFSGITVILSVAAFRLSIKSASILRTFRLESNTAYVQVFDNVLGESSIPHVDTQAAAGGLGHSVLTRNPYLLQTVQPMTAVEAAIEICLRTLDDKSPYVEYWWRDEWISLEAHKDLDEKLYRDSDSSKVRYPTHAHVLFLSIGEAVSGPTVLIGQDDLCSKFVNMTVVPAVPNRLLRMNGTVMHAVPRPSLAYFDPEVGGSNNEIWSRVRRDEVPSSERRSVLLFNTWSGMCSCSCINHSISYQYAPRLLF
jgi:hypothetical protein